MNLDIVTPDKTLFSGEIESIQLPGSEGSFEILKNHAPIVSSLAKGVVRVKSDKSEDLFFEIEGGLVVCKNNIITLLADK